VGRHEVSWISWPLETKESRICLSSDVFCSGSLKPDRKVVSGVSVCGEVKGEIGRGGASGGWLIGGGETEMERGGGTGLDAVGENMGNEAELGGREVGSPAELGGKEVGRV
jgi:hypothetical protein